MRSTIFTKLSGVIAALFLLAACETAPTVDCSTSNVCAVASGIAADLNRGTPRDITDQISLRNVVAEGPVVVFNNDVIFTAERLNGRDREVLQGIGFEVLVSSFCDGRGRSFIQAGGQVAMRFFGRDGVLFSSSFINQCPS